MIVDSRRESARFSNSIQVAVIDCGYFGKNHVHNFAQPGALGLVCDAAEVARHAPAELAPGCPTVVDPASVWESDVEGVVIAAQA